MEKQTTRRLEASIFYLVLRFLSAVLLFQLQYNFHFLSELGHRPWKRQRRTCLECGTQGLRKQQAGAAQRNSFVLAALSWHDWASLSILLKSRSWQLQLVQAPEAQQGVAHVTAQSLVWELLPQNSYSTYILPCFPYQKFNTSECSFCTLFPQPFSTDLQTFMKSWIWNNTNEQLSSWFYSISSWERNKKTRKQNH